MNIKLHFKELGLPTLEGRASLFYQIGTAAITLAVLCLLSWLSVAFGNQFKFSFSWILDAGLIVLYLCHRIHLLVLIASAFSLILLTLISLIIGSPFTSAFGFIVFVILLIGGFILQHHACQSAEHKKCLTQELYSMLFSPLSYTTYLLEKLKFLDPNKI
jgi:hypothetical protein